MKGLNKTVYIAEYTLCTDDRYRGKCDDIPNFLNNSFKYVVVKRDFFMYSGWVSWLKAGKNIAKLWCGMGNDQL